MGQRAYGDGDASYQAAGEAEGIRRLVDEFYDTMDRRPDAARIRAMHPVDLVVSRDKLWCFLSGWLGGPRLYAERYGRISLPGAHAHLEVGVAERDAWLACMEESIARQPWATDFKDYLLEQLGVPAERIRVVCSERAGTGT